MANVILDQSYHGFESFYDAMRDFEECFDPSFNPLAKNIPGEFMGTMRVVVTYTPPEEEEQLPPGETDSF